MTIRAIIAPFPFCYVIPVLLLKDLSCCGYVLPDAKEAFIRMVDCQTARIYFAHQVTLLLNRSGITAEL